MPAALRENLSSLIQHTEQDMKRFDWERFADWFAPERITAERSRRAEFQQLLAEFEELGRRLTALNATDSKAACALWLRHTPERVGVPVFLLPQAQPDERRFIEWVLGRRREMDSELAEYRRLRTSMALRFVAGDRRAALAIASSDEPAAAQACSIDDLLQLLEAKENPRPLARTTPSGWPLH